MEIFGSRFGRKLQPLERNGRKRKLRARALPVDMGTGASRRKSQRPVMPAKRASRRTPRWASTRTLERPSRCVACSAAPRGTRSLERSAPSLAAATARKIRRKSLKNQETGSEMAGAGRRAAESPDARVSGEAPLGADARAGASFEMRRFASLLRMRGLVMIAAPASPAATARKIWRKSLKTPETGSEMAEAGRRPAKAGRPAPAGGDNGPTCA